MAEHLIICRMIGPDLFGHKNWGFEPDIPRQSGAPVPLYKWRKCDIPEADDLEQGYFAIWIECSQAQLATMRTQGYVEATIYEEPDGAVE